MTYDLALSVFLTFSECQNHLEGLIKPRLLVGLQVTMLLLLLLLWGPKLESHWSSPFGATKAGFIGPRNYALIVVLFFWVFCLEGLGLLVCIKSSAACSVSYERWCFRNKMLISISQISINKYQIKMENHGLNNKVFLASSGDYTLK